MAHPINSEMLHHGRGVALYESKDRNGSLAFVSSHFTVFTPLSAWPLLWGGTLWQEMADRHSALKHNFT